MRAVGRSRRGGRRKAGLVGAGGVGEGEVWKWRRTGGGGEEVYVRACGRSRSGER